MEEFEGSPRLKVSARISRTLHRAVRLEAWRRDALEVQGGTVSELVELAVRDVPDDLDRFQQLLSASSCKRARAEPQQVHLQPRVTAETAYRIRLLARSQSFYGDRFVLTTDRDVIITALTNLLTTCPDAHDPYRDPLPTRARRTAERAEAQVEEAARAAQANSRAAAERYGIGHDDTPTR